MLIDLVGHASMQRPQPMHFWRSTSCLSPGSPSIALTGQTSLHFPCPVQLVPMTAFGRAFTSSTIAFVGQTAAQTPQFWHFS